MLLNYEMQDIIVFHLIVDPHNWLFPTTVRNHLLITTQNFHNRAAFYDYVLNLFNLKHLLFNLYYKTVVLSVKQ